MRHPLRVANVRTELAECNQYFTQRLLDRVDLCEERIQFWESAGDVQVNHLVDRATLRLVTLVNVRIHVVVVLYKKHPNLAAKGHWNSLLLNFLHQSLLKHRVALKVRNQLLHPEVIRLLRDLFREVVQGRVHLLIHCWRERGGHECTGLLFGLQLVEGDTPSHFVWEFRRNQHLFHVLGHRVLRLGWLLRRYIFLVNLA